MKTVALFISTAVVLLCALSLALSFPADPDTSDYLFASGITVPANNRETTFHATNDMANFTHFGNAVGVLVTNDTLTFSLSADDATVGWGNYGGEQPASEVKQTCQQSVRVQLRLRQSCTQAVWTVFPWVDGARHSASNRITITSTNWHEPQFNTMTVYGPPPDGFEFDIAATNGTRIEVEWIKLIQPIYEGYCRTEFIVPTGKVWRAVAAVGAADYQNYSGKQEMYSRLYINGQVVDRQKAFYIRHTRGADLRPYLQPGTNCAAFYGFRIGHLFYKPFLYLQSRIIMEDGDAVTLATSTNWTCSTNRTTGWNQPGFNDAGWLPAESGSSPSIHNRNALRQVPIPAYTGRLLMKNPWRRDLFYEGSSNVLVDVHVPRGLTNHTPTLHYGFGWVATNGLTTTTLVSSVSSYTIQDTSAVYRIDLGPQTNAVYTLALSLKDGETVIEERPREPVVVLKKMDQTEVEGTSFTEGMNLVLEDEIDFTDPNDPHPWVESAPGISLYYPARKVETPRIVSTNGLVYREVTFPFRMSGFSYRIEFQHPGSFYYIEVEYPDNAKRVIEICISSRHEKVWTNCQTGYGAETGGRFLPTWKMLKARVIHVADAGPHAIDIINAKEEHAAAKGVKIYRIVGDLPSVGSKENRRYGIHTERCFYTSGVGMNFGVGQPFNSTMANAWDAGATLVQRRAKSLVWLMQTAQRYTQYLKFCGQNCHIMGCHQYSENNTPYSPLPHYDEPRVEQCMKTMLANVFEVNGIDFFSGVEWSQFYNVRSYVNNAGLATGGDTIWMVDRNGEQRYGDDATTIVPNWLHPKVRAAYSNLVFDLAQTFGHLSRYQGMHNQLGPTVRAGYWIPAFGWHSDYDDPLVASYDDVSMAIFTNDTGLSIPVSTNDTERFQKRADYISTNDTVRTQFLNWRCDKVEDFYRDAVQILRDRRSDLEIVHSLEVEDTDFFRYYYPSGKTFDDIMKEFAIDVHALQHTDGLWVGRWTLSWRQAGTIIPTQDPYCWLARTSPDIISTFTHGTNRFVMARTSWDENMYPTGGYLMEDSNDRHRTVESDWIMNCYKIRALPQPGGYHCREGLITGLVTADPCLLTAGFTDININVGHEQMLRSVMKTYTHLPADLFAPVLGTGVTNDLAIRQLVKGNNAWFYIVNPCQWHVSGSVTLETDGTVIDLVSSNQVAQGKTNLPVALEPFGLRAYHVDSGTFAITSYTNGAMDPVELARLEEIPDSVEQQLLDPDVVNGLTGEEFDMTTNTLARVRQAISDRDYALAWSFMTEPPFWTLWKWPDIPRKIQTNRHHWLALGTNNQWHTFGNWSKPGCPGAADYAYFDTACADEPQVISIPSNITVRYLYMEGKNGNRSYTLEGSPITITAGAVHNQSEDGQTFTILNPLLEDNGTLSFYCADGARLELGGGVHSTSWGIQLNAQNATSQSCVYRLSGGSTYGGYTSIRGNNGLTEVIVAHTNAFGQANAGYVTVYELAEATISLATNCTIYDDFESRITNCVMRVHSGALDRVFEVRGALLGETDTQAQLILGQARQGGTGHVILRVRPLSDTSCHLPVSCTAGSIVEFDTQNATITLSSSPSDGTAVISGAGRLRTLGNGTLDVGTAQSYTGGTAIDGGRLRLLSEGGGLPETGQVVIASGAVFDLYERDDTIGGLGGEGHVELDSQTLTVREGLRPGSAGEEAGTLTVDEAGTVVLGAASTNVFELGPTNAANDKLVFTDAGGGLTLGGTLSIVNTGGMEVGSYVLADLNGGTLSGSVAVTNLPTGFSGSVDTSSGDLILTVTGLPGQYYLDTEAGAGGSVTPGDGWYTPGVEVSITASPDTGYHFTGWSGDVPAAQATNAEITVTMDRERSLNAGFAINHYTITAAAGAHGAITPSGSIDVTYGSDRTFTLSPDEDYQVSNVVVDAASVGSTNSYTFTAVSADHTITASFEPRAPVSLSVASARGDPRPGTGSHTYPSGQVVTCWLPRGTLYEGSLQTQYVYTGWTATGSIPSNGVDLGTGQLCLQEDSSIAWHWQTNYWLDVNIIDHTVGHRGGTGSVDVVDAWYGARTNLQLTATEKGGSTFMYWTRDGAWYSDSNPLNLTMDGWRTIGANFTNGYPRYYITATCGVHGTMSPSGVVEIAEGFDTNFTITAHAHYHVEDVLMDGLSAGPKTSYQFADVRADHTLSAEFGMDAYTLKVASSAGGTVDQPGEGSFIYEYDTAVGLQVSAAAQHRFTNWTGTAVTADRVSDPTAASASVTMDADYTVQANFLPEQSFFPFQDSFEPYTPLESVVGTNGWFATPCADAEESASVTNMTYSFTESDVPLPAETHTNVLWLNMRRTYLTNAFEQASHTNVAMDTMVRMIRPEHESEAMLRNRIAAHSTETQFAVYVNTNGHLVLYHGDTLGVDSYTNRFTCLTNGVPAIGTDDWVRLTFTLDYLSDTQDSLKFFQFQANGGAPLAHDAGFRSPSDTGRVRGGPWFLCANVGAAHDHLSTVNLHGNGFFDDLRLCTTNPLAERYWTVYASSDPGAVISPSGAVMVEHGQDSSEFAITPAGDYTVTNVLIDGTTLIGPTNAYTFTGVTTNHTIRVLTSARMCSLSVSTPFGIPDPAAGVHLLEASNLVTCTVGGSPCTAGATQYLCTGWTGTGSVPPAGSATNTEGFLITNHSTLAWQWQTNLWLDTGTDGHGTVDAADGWYAQGTTVVVTATAAPDYDFLEWTGDTNGCTVNGNQITLAMTVPRTVGAAFQPSDPRQLSIVSDRGSPVPAIGTHTYPSGTVLATTCGGSPELEGSQSTQYVCTGWTGTGSVPGSGSGTNAGSFTLNQDSSLAWLWQTNVWLAFDVVDLTPGGGGGTGTVDRTDGWYTIQSNLTITAVPEGGSSFTYWLRDGEFFGDSYSNPVTLMPDRPRDLTACFTGGTRLFEITATADPEGSISPSGVVHVMEGYATSFVIQADAHYHVDDVLLDGASEGATNLYTLANVAAHHTLHACFAIDQHTLTVASTAGGSVTKPGEGVFTNDYGRSIALQAQSKDRHFFTNWTGSAVDSGLVDDPLAEATTMTLQGDVDVLARFEYYGNLIPFSDSFETYTPDQSVIGSNGWYCLQPAAATIVQTSYTFTACGVPLPWTTHTNVLVLNTDAATLTNRVDPQELSNVVMDVMVTFGRVTNPDVDMCIAEENDTQFGVYVNHHGYPVIFHSEDTGGGVYENRFTVLTNGVAPLPEDEWARLTVTFDYLSGKADALKYFKVQWNGGVPFSHATAYLDPEDPGAGTGGRWFLCANVESVTNRLGRVELRGTGRVDDLRLDTTNSLPPVSWTITPSADPGGQILPSTPQTVQDGQDSVEFLISSLATHTVTNVLLDGTQFIGPTNAYRFTCVLTNHTIRVMMSGPPFGSLFKIW